MVLQVYQHFDNCAERSEVRTAIIEIDLRKTLRSSGLISILRAFDIRKK